MKKLQCGSYDEFMASFSLDVPENYNFTYDFLDAVAAEDPQRPAMVHVDPDGVRRDYDMAYFSRESARLAAAFQRMGVRKGDRFMLILYRRVEFWVTTLALARIGAVAIPSPALLTPKDIVFRVNKAEVAGAVVDESVVDRIDAARPECPTLRHLVRCGVEAPADGWEPYESLLQNGDGSFTPPAERPGGADPLYIFFTSGTTGMPKMVEHTHTYPLGHYTTGLYWHDLRPGDVHLTLADTGWAKTQWGKYYGQWLAGAAIFVWDFRGKFEPAELLHQLSEHHVTSFCAPPTVYRFLVREDLSAYDLSALRHCTTAGELLNDNVFHEWKRITGLPIYEGYGQTETCLQVTTLPCMEPKPGSIGKPAPGWPIVLLDENEKPCPEGEEGEICIDLRKGTPVGLFLGYLDEPEKTDRVLNENYYHTGDKAWRDEDGYLWFLGRTDDLIKSSGYRIGPFEVESALVSHPAVVEAAVTGVPDPVRGQAVKATVVLAAGFEGSAGLTKELQDHVKKVTAPYKYPRLVEYVTELPKTISGKIKRAEIRERDEAAN
ncbi:MAG: AMP-binding protein [Desulfovibrionaceae bacterium]|nr:AMP-binding protein [Desulfovibrionaceae bacterium]